MQQQHVTSGHRQGHGLLLLNQFVGDAKTRGTERAMVNNTVAVTAGNHFQATGLDRGIPQR